MTLSPGSVRRESCRRGALCLEKYATCKHLSAAWSHCWRCARWKSIAWKQV